tara:strand:+ start:5872 stop:7047 length:1176 start_codon:yes stop_codon:yes gene_type:complete
MTEDIVSSVAALPRCVPWQAKYREGVVRLFRDVPYKDQLWTWQFESNPFALPFTPVLLVDNDDQVVGFNGVMAVIATDRGEQMPVLWSCDFYLAEQWRGRGLGTEIKHELHTQSPVIMAFGISERASDVLRHLGWVPDTSVRSYRMVCRLTKWRSLALWCIQQANRIIGRARSVTYVVAVARGLELSVHSCLPEQCRVDALSLSDFYRQSVSFWPDPAMALVEPGEGSYGLTAPLPGRVPDNDLKTLMWRDLNWYLPDDILTKVDRAAMACSLETRIPMLDHRVVSFAMGLPASLNMEGNVGKQVLRSVLYRHVPRELIDRPKQGFAVPVAAWLRGSLREWAETLLDPVKLREQGYWKADMVRQVWSEHLSGREDYSFELWGILMFESWLD